MIENSLNLYHAYALFRSCKSIGNTGGTALCLHPNPSLGKYQSNSLVGVSAGVGLIVSRTLGYVGIKCKPHVFMYNGKWYVGKMHVNPVRR